MQVTHEHAFSLLRFIIILIGLGLLLDKLVAGMTFQLWAAIILISAGLAL